MAFAKRGASVTLAARREAVLREAAVACEGEGGRSLAVPTDVGDPETVRQLARRAIEAFGKIDVWINNAGVGAVGGFVETPIEAHDQVVRTNLLGYLHGAHAVLPHFVERGAGVLINNLSFGAWVPAPFAARLQRGSVATLARLGYFIAPRLMRAGSATLMKTYLAQASSSPITDGNLFRPMAESQAIEGGWRSPAERAMVTAGLAIAAGLTALLLMPRAARGAGQ
jgi:short chain dehydrogenase